MKITIAGRDYRAELPPSYTLQQELAVLLHTAPLRASGALLGLSCQGLTRVQLSACGWSMGDYAGRVLDVLHREHGVSVTDALEAAAPLIEALAERVAPPTEEEVSGTEDFSEAPAP